MTDAIYIFLIETLVLIYKKCLKGIFETLETGLSNWERETSGARTKLFAIDLFDKDIPMDGRQDYDVLGFIYEYPDSAILRQTPERRLVLNSILDEVSF